MRFNGKAVQVYWGNGLWRDAVIVGKRLDNGEYVVEEFSIGFSDLLRSHLGYTNYKVMNERYLQGLLNRDGVSVRISKYWLDFNIPGYGRFNTVFGYYASNSNLAKWISFLENEVTPFVITHLMFHGNASSVFKIRMSIPHEEYLEMMRKKIEKAEKEGVSYVQELWNRYYEEYNHWTDVGLQEAYKDVSAVMLILPKCCSCDGMSYTYVWSGKTVRDVPNPFDVCWGVLKKFVGSKYVKKGLFRRKEFAMLDGKLYPIDRNTGFGYGKVCLECGDCIVGVRK